MQYLIIGIIGAVIVVGLGIFLSYMDKGGKRGQTDSADSGQNGKNKKS